ncbi:MAG: TIR domain-containing protein [Lachnospiraceae bacterium]|nr:TIR domain-containing protein [Lachnospiraceae bacterium]
MNEPKDIHYDAFISYRHSELDSFVASNLHKKLESFKLPKSVLSKVKNGKTGIERIFRDVDELPLSDNLSDPITNALNNSDYLITICSPRYPQSKWCLKEIETFLESHPRDHILMVLAEGEPIESFPEILTYEQIKVTDENGNERFERKDIEPLAADTRGSDKKEIRKAIDITVLKLCAAMFGLNYDDLKQRHREARMRKLMTVFGIAGAFLLCFAIVVTGMLIKISTQSRIISSQYSELKDKYADTIADRAAELYGSGRRMDAIYALRSVLPGDDSEEYNANALRELYTYMGVYGGSADYVPGNVYEMDSEVYDYYVSESGEYILVNDLLCMRLFDRSGRLIREFKNEDSVYFTEGIICGEKGVLYSNGEELRFYSIDDSEDILITELEGGCSFYDIGADAALAYGGAEVTAVDDSGTVLFSIDVADKYKSSDLIIFQSDSDGGKIACSFSNYSDHYLLVADAYTGDIIDSIQASSDYNVPLCLGDEYLYYAVTEYGENGEDKCMIHATRPGSGTDRFCVETDGGMVYDLWENNGYLYAYTISGLEVYSSENGKEITVFSPYGEITCGIDAFDGMVFADSSGKVYKSYEDQIYEVTDSILPKEGGGKIARIEFSRGSYYIHFERADYVSAYHANVITDDGEYFDADYDELFGEDATFDLEEDPDFNSLLLDQAVYSEDGEYIAASYSNHTVKILDAGTYECIASYDLDRYILSLKYSEITKSYILVCDETSYVLDNDFKIICDMGMYAGDGDGCLIIGDVDGAFRLAEWTGYNELILMADELLGDYKPRDSILDKYGI